MTQIWINALIANLIISFGIWKLLHRTSITPQLKATILAISFVVPIYPPTGINRLLYLTDIATPALIYFAIKSKNCSKDIKIISLLLIISAGILPFIFSIGFASDYVAQMSTASNLWRTISVASILLIFGGHFSKGARIEDINKVIIWACGTICATLALQVFFGFDTNIYEKFYLSEMNSAENTFDPNMRYWFMGMFKAQIGYIGMIAFAYALFITQRKDLFSSALFVATTSLLITITSGSKTSLLCIALFLIITILLRPRKSIKKIILILTPIAAVFLALHNNFDISDKLNSTLVSFIESQGSDTQTLDYRHKTWESATKEMIEQPLSILGIYTAPVPNFKPGYFHNEYLSILALGGIESLLLYIATIMTITYKAIRKTLKGDDLGLLALLIVLGGIAQGWTVAHLQPSVLFLTSTSMCAVAYSMVFRNKEIKQGST